MEVRNCKGCGRLFNYIGGVPLCGDCKAKLEEKFGEVKKYIEENKHATIPEVAEAMDVSQRQITQWIREERLAFADDSAITLSCEACGAPVRTGRYCEACKTEMTRNFGNMYKSAATPPSPTKDRRESARMRYLDD